MDYEVLPCLIAMIAIYIMVVNKIKGGGNNEANKKDVGKAKRNTRRR